MLPGSLFRKKNRKKKANISINMSQNKKTMALSTDKKCCFDLFAIFFEHWIVPRTKDKTSSLILFQAISMELQRRNCASLMDTMESPRLSQDLIGIIKQTWNKK